MPRPPSANISPTNIERLWIIGTGLTVAAVIALLKAYTELPVPESLNSRALIIWLIITGIVAALGIQRLLDVLSSVRFGVILLVLLASASMVGMLVMQVNVDGFDRYYAELSPAQKIVGRALGFFDIYHAWYFNALLLVLSLNIVLASIDHFPKAWTFISRKKLDASAHWLKGQDQHASLTLSGESRAAVVERIAAAFKSVGLRKPIVTEKGDKLFVFGERGAWNRLAAYAVHVALLTIFLGGFLTGMYGHTGNLRLRPGESGSIISETVFKIDPQTRQFEPTTDEFELPFTVECTDIQQQLIKKEGPITADNTMNWRTWVRFKKEGSPDREALVELNHPIDYGGFRFFQASFEAEGKARHITLRITPEQGGTPQNVTIKRDGSATLADGTRVEFKDFSGNFRLGGAPPPQESDYSNPGATLAVTPPGGATVQAFAFNERMAESAPIAKRPVAGYTFRLVDFEKSPSAHILSVQRDPGATLVYIGFTLLGLTLIYAFFFSHQRVWALVEPRGGAFGVVLGGNTNRNKLAFGDRFKRLVGAIDGQTTEVKQS
ncbi:MAG TPA: cytochrome c biogenesis protein ResB [Pyrinomonadaceae bacterium]|nr:cytochrome c biogenesis protein ResB [Pyrinomonadaceae bacterium]